MPVGGGLTAAMVVESKDDVSNSATTCISSGRAFRYSTAPNVCVEVMDKHDVRHFDGVGNFDVLTIQLKLEKWKGVQQMIWEIKKIRTIEKVLILYTRILYGNIYLFTGICSKRAVAGITKCSSHSVANGLQVRQQRTVSER